MKLQKLKAMAIVSLIYIFFSMNLYAAKRPKWINEPLKACSAGEICAVGFGTGPALAEADARKNLAKFFSTKVTATTTSTTNSMQKSDQDGPFWGSIEEDVYSMIEEKTDQLLTASYIKKKYQDEQNIYALAALNKGKASRKLRTQMMQIDEKVQSFYFQGRRSSLSKALKLLAIRNGLNLHYELLTNTLYNAPLNYRKVMNKKEKIAKKEVVILLSISKNSKNVDELSAVVIKELLANDYRVIVDLKKPYHFKVYLKFFNKKLHLNVKGFVKYRFNLVITSYDKRKRKLGRLEFATSQVGRDFKQAYENALPEMRTFIHDKLDELKID